MWEDVSLSFRKEELYIFICISGTPLQLSILNLKWAEWMVHMMFWISICKFPFTQSKIWHCLQSQKSNMCLPWHHRTCLLTRVSETCASTAGRYNDYFCNIKMENLAIHSIKCKMYIEKTFLKAPDSGSPKLTPSTEEYLKPGSSQVLYTPQV